ncbi:MAG: PEGA domain-containing protein [Deltaproteobacteria bacterium]|nr:PEGA domain-containing protein [Deltaproteobacteria bacterium]
MKVSCLVILLSLMGVGAGEEVPRIAVFDFKGMGLDEMELRFLMEEILVEIDGTGKFKSIGKSDLETMLGMEELKQQLNSNCDTSCMAEIAGTIGARYVLAGLVSKTGDEYLVLMKMIDQMRANVLRRISRRIKGTRSAVYRTLPGMLSEVLGLKVTAVGKEKAKKGSGVGYIEVSSLPLETRKSEIVLDGRVMAERTPGTLKDVPAGEHTVLVRRFGYQEWKDKVTVESDKITRVVARLEPLGRLFVNSSPTGAQVSLDGKVSGKTPLRVAVEPGDHLLELSYGNDYLPYKKRINVLSGKVNDIRVTLEKKGRDKKKKALALVNGVVSNKGDKSDSQGGLDSYDWGWILTGAAMALAAGAGISVVLGALDESEADSRYADYKRNPTEAGAKLVKDAGDTAAMEYNIAWGLGGVGAALLVGGIISFSFSPDDGEGVSYRVSPTFFTNGFGLVIGLEAWQ